MMETEWKVTLDPEAWVNSLLKTSEANMWQTLGLSLEIDDVVVFSSTAKESGVIVKRQPLDDGIVRAVKTKDLQMLLERIPNMGPLQKNRLQDDANEASRDHKCPVISATTAVG
jgi:hypothetical protein